MALGDVVSAIEWVFLLYFTGLNAGYLALNLVSIVSLWRYMQTRGLSDLPRSFTGIEPPVSILVPAYNEELVISASVRSLLQLNYPEFEVIVINDGSRDGTLEVLKREFSLVPLPEAHRIQLRSRKVRAFYLSTKYPNLRVLDKENGGKADSLNAGINAARHALFCGVDADSILQRDSLRRVVQPFTEDERTIAAGGTVRIANGCEVSEGFLVRTGLPKSLLAQFQIIEYLRAFLFGRMGWSPLNAMLIISGAFGVFLKKTVVQVGGYRTDTVGEDMELVVRLHRFHRLHRKPYRITFVPDPICWTEAPETLRVLRSQRVRWQRGLCESLVANLGLWCHPRGGAPGWLAFPFMAIFEWLGPMFEVFGYAFFVTAFMFDLISAQHLWLFLFVAVGFGLMLSFSALFLETLSFHVYQRPRDMLRLFLMAILENIGYRQLNSLWRMWGILIWLFGIRAKWGEMTRHGNRGGAG